VKNDSLRAVTEQLFFTICEHNDIDPESISLHLFESPTINAFVIPGNHIILFTGLIEYTKSAEELAGVIAHELAHIQENHLEDRLVKLIGINVLIFASGLDAGAYLIAELIRTLAATAFTRDQEREADLAAVEYLHKAGMAPDHLAVFMLRLSKEESTSGVSLPVWLKTHPDSRSRAMYIMEASQEKEKENEYAPAYSGDWKELIQARL
ncbi:M48 family metallopeptidase, partial [Balneolaceae bacterium ANBcel3]|nr:M48 family metallopeptidase [Balneolaceae bacterium ANBcel3]